MRVEVELIHINSLIKKRKIWKFLIAKFFKKNLRSKVSFLNKKLNRIWIDFEKFWNDSLEEFEAIDLFFQKHRF